MNSQKYTSGLVPVPAEYRVTESHRCRSHQRPPTHSAQPTQATAGAPPLPRTAGLPLMNTIEGGADAFPPPSLGNDEKERGGQRIDGGGSGGKGWGFGHVGD